MRSPVPPAIGIRWSLAFRVAAGLPAKVAPSLRRRSWQPGTKSGTNRQGKQSGAPRCPVRSAVRRLREACARPTLRSTCQPQPSAFHRQATRAKRPPERRASTTRPAERSILNRRCCRRTTQKSHCGRPLRKERRSRAGQGGCRSEFVVEGQSDRSRRIDGYAARRRQIRRDRYRKSGLSDLVEGVIEEHGGLPVARPVDSQPQICQCKAVVVVEGTGSIIQRIRTGTVGEIHPEKA